MTEATFQRGGIVAWVTANPSCTAVDVAEAFGTTTKIAGAHLDRAVVAGDLIRSQEPVGSRCRWRYGAPTWRPRPVRQDVRPSPLLVQARGRLAVVRAEIVRLSAEARVLEATIEGYEALDDPAEDA